MEGSEGAGHLEHAIALEDARRQEDTRINDLVLKFQTGATDQEKGEIIQELWLKIEPIIKRFVQSRERQDVDDMVQDFYLKFPYVASKWRDSGKFSAYCLVTISRMMINRRQKLAGETRVIKRLADEPIFDNSTENRSPFREDKAMIEKIKSKLISWVQHGLLTPVEAMSLILRFCLGRNLARELFFKSRDQEPRIARIDPGTIDFSYAMGEEVIGKLLGNQQPAVSKMIKRAIRKIQAELSNEIRI